MILAPACLAAGASKPTDYEKGAAAFQKKDYVSAIDNFEQALAKQPNNANVCYGLASAFSAVGQKFQALNFYRQCLALAPHSPIAENAQKGIDYLQSGGTASSTAAAPTAPKQSSPANSVISTPSFAQSASPHKASPQPDPSSSLAPWQRLAAMAPPLPPEAQQTMDSASQSAQSALQPPGQQGNAPFAMGQGRKGQKQQQQSGNLPPPSSNLPYGGYGRAPGQSAGGSSQGRPSPGGYGGGWSGGGGGSQLGGPFGRQRGFPGNQQSGQSSGPFSFTGPQQDPLGLGGGLQGHRHRHQMQPIGGYATSYNFGGGRVPTMVIREYSFPPSLNKSDDEPILVEMMAKQQRLVIDGPTKATPLIPDDIRPAPVNATPVVPDSAPPVTSRPSVPDFATPANSSIPMPPTPVNSVPTVPDAATPVNSIPGIPDAVNPSP
jgi:hypothetical protein